MSSAPDPLACRKCGHTEIEERPGRGPHHRELRCRGCGEHIGWKQKPRTVDAPITDKQRGLMRRLFKQNPPPKRVASVLIDWLRGAPAGATVPMAAYAHSLLWKLSRDDWKAALDWLKARAEGEGPKGDAR